MHAALTMVGQIGRAGRALSPRRKEPVPASVGHSVRSFQLRPRHGVLASALLLITGLAMPAIAAPPYPQSNRITAIQWEPGTYQSGGLGGGIWPVTWAANGSLLTAWGDGIVTCPQKVSYGFAALATELPGVGLNGLSCGPGPTGKGKVMAMVGTSAATYAVVNLQNGGYPYPIWKSTDGGRNWAQSASTPSILLDSFVQVGRANAGAPGGYVYALEPSTTQIRLLRVPAASVDNFGAYQYFSGTAFAPAWKTGKSGSTVIFTDPAGVVRPTMTYDPALNRYLLAVAHSTSSTTGANKLGLFEAPNPWGPWRTVSYVENFLGISGGRFYGMHFPVKWQADGGATLWATFSCTSTSASQSCGTYDSRFNLLKATLTTVPAPPPPNAVADARTTSPNTAVVVPVLSNDTGTSLDVRTVTTPANGTARINSDDSVTYTPNTGYTGSDSFSYLASDSFEQPATATVTVTVENRPPVAGADSATTVAPNSISRIPVLANDSDPDGHTLTVASVATPGNGTATVTSDRKAINYKPAARYSGTDSFTYTVSDGRGGTAQGRVTIAVTNSSPIAVADSATTIAGKSVRIFVLANDSDPESHVLTVAQVTPGSNGTVTRAADLKSVTYTPAASFVGSDSFSYTASDGYGGTAQAQVTVSVTNRPPNAVADVASVIGGRLLKLTVIANDSDPDGHPISVQAVGGASHGDARPNPDNPGGVIYEPDIFYTGPDSFTYTIRDRYGATASSTVTVNVGNRPPVVTADAASTPYNTIVTIRVLANDTDPDGHDLRTVAVSKPSNGIAEISVDDRQVIYRMIPGFEGVDTFTYTATDGYGGNTVGQVTVTVGPSPWLERLLRLSREASFKQ